MLQGSICTAADEPSIFRRKECFCQRYWKWIKGLQLAKTLVPPIWKP